MHYPSGVDTVTKTALSHLNIYIAELHELFLTSRLICPAEVLNKEKWDSLFYMYKLGLAKLVYKVYFDLTPPDMRHIIVKAENKHGLRNGNKVVVPSFNTNFMKHSIAHRGSVIWNALSQHLNVKTSNFNSFFNIGRGKNILKNISFEALSAHTVILTDDVFKFY